MLKSSEPAFARTPLPELGAVRVQGPDAVRFLQGQLSNDVALLAADRSLLAGLHNAQGRVTALMRLIWVGEGDVLAVLPREVAPGVATRLGKFVLRAKAKVTDGSQEWAFFGLTALESAGASATEHSGDARRDEEGSLVALIGGSPMRWLLAMPSNTALATPPDTAQGAPLSARAGVDSKSGRVAADPHEVSHQRWHAADIAAGLPQVYGATSEQFVAQMLNLDVVGAISFTKGCYTGQEVIARAHYRGRVKRRMQRFRTVAAAHLSAGDTGKLRDGRSFRVVDAAALPDGRCEFLAVAPTSASEDEPADSASSAAMLDAEALPLPYELPA
jgi:tRNA-modifying protein YgfZ